VSPEPYVRGQALVLAGLLVASTLIGSPLATLICVVAGIGLYLALRLKYTIDRSAAASAGGGDHRGGERDTTVPPHRERLDMIVAGDANAALGIGLAASGVAVALSAGAYDSRVPPLSATLAVVAWMSVYLSSLVDWYIILPRISGQLGVRPCRSPDRDHPRFPHTWRETTRWWLVHRILAAFILRTCLLYALTFAIRDSLGVPYGYAIVGGAAFVWISAYIAAIPRACIEVGHGTLFVGQTVSRRATQRVWRYLPLPAGHRLRLPLFRSLRVGERGPREYVFDVELEGVQFVPATSREGTRPADAEDRFERNPLRIRFRDLASVEPTQERFSGCYSGCSGINWYCIENPKCFRPK
jgi:hypothetical protein